MRQVREKEDLVTGIDFVDKSGEFPTRKEIQDCKAAVTQTIVKRMIQVMTVDPELAINLTTIKRCLDVLEVLVATTEIAQEKKT